MLLNMTILKFVDSGNYFEQYIYSECISFRHAQYVFLSARYKLNFISRENYCIYIPEKYICIGNTHQREQFMVLFVINVVLGIFIFHAEFHIGFHTVISNANITFPICFSFPIRCDLSRVIHQLNNAAIFF